MFLFCRSGDFILVYILFNNYLNEHTILKFIYRLINYNKEKILFSFLNLPYWNESFHPPKIQKIGQKKKGVE